MTKTTIIGRIVSTVVLSLVFFLFGAGANAQVTTAAEFEAYLKALLESTEPQKNVYLPGVSHAVVAPHGTGYASASLFGPRGVVRGAGADGAVSLGFGLGNAETSIGASITANITGTIPFGTDGDFTVKFSKMISSGSGTTFVGLSFGRLAGWGVNAALATSSEGSITHFDTMSFGSKKTPIMVTIGYSNLSGAFGGIGFGLTENLGAGISTKSGKVTVGVGYKVPKSNGMSINLDASNIFVAGGSATIFTFGVSYSISDLF